MEQLELIPPAEQFECDGCDCPGQAPAGEIPTGWIIIGRGILCVREKGRREAVPVELHHCAECKLLETPRLDHRRRQRS
jgi:hypothetical protein